MIVKTLRLMDFKATGTKCKGPATFHFFIIHRWTGTLQNLGVEHSEIGWIPLADAPSLPNLALPAYMDLFQ